VTDGDTLVTDAGVVRLYGADTPENCAPCYRLAAKALRDLAGNSVRLQPGPRAGDSFGRTLAYAFTESGDSIEETLVRAGLAEAWRADGQHAELLIAAEAAARQSGHGCIWGGLSAADVAPADAPPAPSPVAPGPMPAVRLQRVWPWLQINDPLFIAHVPGSEECVAVVSQDGVIELTSADPLATEGRATTLLDITGRVSRSGNEEGLLGLAFHPAYEVNGRIFVYYSAASPRRTVLAEFTAGPEATAEAASERVLLEILQPFSNHNGGMVAFGPDGYLYVGVGDGGSGGDPFGHGQDKTTLLGSILRIDVDARLNGPQYGIPADNPFASGGGAREIWAYGLRNPWRFSFDRTTGLLWAGDVGQNAWEEIDVVRRGRNYGWNIMEGRECFSPRTGCDTEGLELPVAVYGRSDGCSVTGGYVYRGAAIPALYGAYLFGDYCTGRIWALRDNGLGGPAPELLLDTSLAISSFGEDAGGEIYILDHRGGTYRLTGD
jgi:glucose/arabinose dehydrogenase